MAPLWHHKRIGHSGCRRSARVFGGPSRTRTLDPLIKSPSRGLRTAMHDAVRARDPRVGEVAEELLCGLNRNELEPGWN